MSNQQRNTMNPYLWIAYDYTSTSQCLAMLDTILEKHSDTNIIHEIGRPTLLHAALEGFPIVTEFRKRLNNRQILVADFKGFDVPYSEVGVITQMNSDFNLTKNCTPGKPSDPCMAQFEQGTGVYTSNATFAGHIRKSDPARPVADLFIFGLPVPYQGYYPGWSKPLSKVENQFSWTVLKAHTRNRAGTVKLRSADPRDTPEINFHYFTEGSDIEGEDLESVIKGVEFVRRMNAHIADISQEVIPGAKVRSREEIIKFVESEAWGHHASCSNKMGALNDPIAVVDSEFCVRGVRNLRVVDASVFPRVPGYFIVTPIYMISEKASDVILASAESRKILPAYESM